MCTCEHELQTACCSPNPLNRLTFGVEDLKLKRATPSNTSVKVSNTWMKICVHAPRKTLVALLIVVLSPASILCTHIPIPGLRDKHAKKSESKPAGRKPRLSGAARRRDKILTAPKQKRRDGLFKARGATINRGRRHR